MLWRLAARQKRKQLSGGFSNVIGAGVKSTACRISYNMLLAGLFVCVDGFAQTSALRDRGHVDQKVKSSLISPFSPCPDVTQFSPQLRASRIGESIELCAPRQHEAIAKGQTSPNESSQQEHKYRPEEGADANYTGKRINHYNPFLMLAFNFFGGILASLAIAFILRAKKYGINSAWRDLVYNWPIPDWMRFVPKEEQDL